MKTRKIKKLLLTILSFVLFLSMTCLSAIMLTNNVSHVIADGIPNISLDKVDSPISGRTSWANDSRPLGFVIYLNGVSFATGNTNVHLQNGMTAESLAKITFTRGETTVASPVLICAGSDGGYGSKSFFAFFFGGALLGQTVNTYQEGDRVIIDEGCILTCAEGSYNVAEKIDYEYDGSAWVAVVEEKEWTVTNVTTSVWVAASRKLGVDIYRSAAAQSADPLTNNNTGMLSLVNDSTKVTYTRNGVSEHPSIIIGNTVYVAYCFAGTTIGATDTTPLNGDLFTVETGFVFKYNASDANRYYAARLQYEYFNGTWRTCSYSNTATWANSSVDSTKSAYSNVVGYLGIRTYCTDTTIAASQTDGIQLSVFDLTKITFYRQGSSYHPTRIIGATYTMHYLFSAIPNEDFVSGDMLVIEAGFSFIYNDTRYTYSTGERYVFTGSTWRVPSLSGRVEKMNVSLNENINAVFTFKLPADNVDNGTNQVCVTVSGVESVINVNTLAEKNRDEDWVYYDLSVELNPTLLTADIQFYFKSIVSENFYCSKVFHKSVKEYCDYIIQNGTEDQVNMVKALLNYGGYAQTFFGVNTDNLANAGLYETDPINSVTVSDAYEQSATSASGLTFRSMQLYLETTPTMRFYFTLADGYAIGEYSFKLTTASGDYYLSPEYDDDNDRYYVDVENIPAKHIGTAFTVSATNNNDSTVYSIESSVNCYIKIALDNVGTTPAKANMLKALYLYGSCANAFAN